MKCEAVEAMSKETIEMNCFMQDYNNRCSGVVAIHL